MKKDLLRWLRCPDCKKELNLEVFEFDGDEIKEGSLCCTCGKMYSITGYIPRFANYANYVDSFGFEWGIHRKTQLDSARGDHLSEDRFKNVTGFHLDRLKGASILDVGCGTGRFAEVAGRYGGKVVGVDLSSAVDVAFENLGRKGNFHFIQGDIFSLPFEPGTFDYIFSIGVLHHTPDCEKAFKSLPPLLKEGGRIAIWVYDSYRIPYLNETLRSITKMLPKRLLYYLGYASVPLYYGYRIPIVRFFLRSLQAYMMIILHPEWRMRVLDTFDWYACEYQSKHTYYEVFRWFIEAGLHDIEVRPVPVSLSGKA